MTNDSDLLPGAGLMPSFAPSVSLLAGTIRTAADLSGAGGTATRNAESHLLTIRANAERDTPGLYDALDSVRSAVRAVEDIARRQATLVPNQVALLANAQTHAFSALGFLTAVLRVAKPNVRPRRDGLTP